MAMGDNDIAAGVFFVDFGQVVTFNGARVKGNFDAPGKDAMFDRTSVSDTDYTLMLAAGCFSPMPDTTARLTVAGAAYQVVSASSMDDGLLVELKLRKL